MALSRKKKTCSRVVEQKLSCPVGVTYIFLLDDDDDDDNKCMLIDVAISGERNVIKKEAEKILKYKDLTIEI